MKGVYRWGLITGFGLGCLYFMVPVIWESFTGPPRSGVEPPRFEVVDNYRGCDVVRWEPSGFREYKFFLDCRTSK